MKDNEKIEQLEKLNYNIEVLQFLINENFNKMFELLKIVKDVDRIIKS